MGLAESRYNNYRMKPPEKIHCMEIEYRINPYVRLIPIFLWATTAMVLKETNPRTKPLIKRFKKLNHQMELRKKLFARICPLRQKLIEIMATDMA
jgi:hypothetical protein